MSVSGCECVVTPTSVQQPVLTDGCLMTAGGEGTPLISGSCQDQYRVAWYEGELWLGQGMTGMRGSMG